MINDLWYKNAVIYCLSVATYMDANGDGIGDFQGLMRRLDYLQGMGVTAIWLMPFQPSPGKDGGYDVADFYGVDPKYGGCQWTPTKKNVCSPIFCPATTANPTPAVGTVCCSNLTAIVGSACAAWITCSNAPPSNPDNEDWLPFGLLRTNRSVSVDNDADESFSDCPWS